MKFTRRHILTGAMALAANPALARWPQTVPEGLIFFVGNSFTRQHDIPARVCRIAEISGAMAHCHRHTANGAHLDDHLPLAQQIEKEHPARIPATVVLQDHSTAPLTPELRTRSAEAVAAFASRFQRTVLFETWPRRADHRLYSEPGMPSDPEEMARRTHHHYARLATRPDVLLAPVARAWIEAQRAGLDVYARDGYHANRVGAWLAAHILADVLGFAQTGRAPPFDDVLPSRMKALRKIARSVTS